MKIEIKSVFGLLLFECEADSLKGAVIGAVGEKADLRGADLREADLREAYLREAYLRGADLRGADLREAYLREADLRGAYLREAYLREANLYRANLRGADLREANLREANLYRADLRGADLRGANLREADLREANLREAYLRGADLRGANLREADLREANLREADLRGADLRGAGSIFLQCPEAGQFTAFKKCKDNKIVTLLIPEDAKRSSSTSRKCRCDKAIVVAIDDGKKQYETAVSSYSSKFIYKVGEEVFVDNFCENRWEECAAGIHFFITKEEAIAY